MEKINQLKQQIRQQRDENILLYNQMPIATKEDPSNKKAEPILKKWREGSKRLKALLRELQDIELSQIRKKGETKKQFVNSFGEATRRTITTTTYERIQKRLDSEILSFMGNN